MFIANTTVEGVTVNSLATRLISIGQLKVVFIIMMAATQAIAQPLRAPYQLMEYRNERFGFKLKYPSVIFIPEASPESGDGQTFNSVDGAARIVTYAALNDEKLSLAQYRRTLMTEYNGYDMLDYQPQGKTWFVLSGFRGDRIFYEKIMFSCRNQVVNVLAISFPTAEKRFYEPIVEQLEDAFKTGAGSATPVGC
jgi:hypothetical protein